MNFFNVLSLLSGTVISGGGSTEPAATAAAATAATAETVGGGFFGGMSIFSTVLIYAAVLGAMWFFMIRPQKKREKEIKAMQESIKTGDNIITSSGFHGRVMSIADDSFIIEFGTNKSVLVPVRKSDVFGTKAVSASNTAKEPKESKESK